MIIIAGILLVVCAISDSFSFSGILGGVGCIVFGACLLWYRKRLNKPSSYYAPDSWDRRYEEETNDGNNLKRT
jgi:hypothetical protein